MELRTRVESDLKQALRDRNAVARDTLRMILAELKNKEIDVGRDLSAEEEAAVFQRALKTRRESVEQFEKAGRADLVARERAEIEVVKTYLPRMLEEGDARRVIQAFLAETGITSRKDMGAAMKAVMSRHKGQIDGKLAQRILGELLT